MRSAEDSLFSADMKQITRHLADCGYCRLLFNQEQLQQTITGKTYKHISFVGYLTINGGTLTTSQKGCLLNIISLHLQELGCSSSFGGFLLQSVFSSLKR